jgi:hypothetical protein
MCRTHQHLINSNSWSWDGNQIEPNTIIPNCRKISGMHTLYNVDIRQFITSVENKIVKNTLEDIYERLPPVHKAKFTSRKEGSFDFRVDVIKEYISQQIAYRNLKGEFDSWLFPEETITLKEGDCEDRAFLLASLILASGISKYVVRVAFGKIFDKSGHNKFDHVWVMYKNEKGIWQLIDPMNYRPKHDNLEIRKGQELEAGKSYIYRPYYVMNCDHLWSVASPYPIKTFPQYIEQRSFWTGFYPTFGYKVHKEIVNSAIDPNDFKSFLKEKGMEDQLLTLDTFDDTESAICLNQFAYQVSNVDISLRYEPRLHFDNALIKESFALMADNMNLKNLHGLANAFHAIGDIYAHTSFVEFAKVRNEPTSLGIFEIADSANSEYINQFLTLPNYETGIFDLTRFTNNDYLYKLKDNKAQAIQFWKDKVISGRFGQTHDSQGLLERTQFWPRGLQKDPMQGALPHHNEIAVDVPVFDPKKHKLFTAESEYKRSYELRKKLAVQHISKKYDEWKSLF